MGTCETTWGSNFEDILKNGECCRLGTYTVTLLIDNVSLVDSNVHSSKNRRSARAAVRTFARARNRRSALFCCVSRLHKAPCCSIIIKQQPSNTIFSFDELQIPKLQNDIDKRVNKNEQAL